VTVVFQPKGMIMRLKFAAVAFLVGTVSALAHESSNAGVTVAHPWARATPGGATIGAAFLEIKTATGVDDTLLSIASPVAGRVELHTHIRDGDVMKMRRVEKLPLKAGGSTVLKPHGDHVMLMDLKAPLKEGDLIKLVLTFAKAGPLEIEATVEPIGAMGPHGMDHQPGTGNDDSAHKH
jgi:periplasmic copper chaperone A